MNDKRIDEAFNYLKGAWIALEQVAGDRKGDPAMRDICKIAADVVRAVSNSLVNFTTTD